MIVLDRCLSQWSCLFSTAVDAARDCPRCPARRWAPLRGEAISTGLQQLASTANTSRVFSSAGIFVRRDRAFPQPSAGPQLSTSRDPAKKYESVDRSIFERMFDSVFAAASDVELVAAIEDGVRQERSPVRGGWPRSRS